jgi:hypothetical protein
LGIIVLEMPREKWGGGGHDWLSNAKANVLGHRRLGNAKAKGVGIKNCGLKMQIKNVSGGRKVLQKNLLEMTIDTASHGILTGEKCSKF